MRISAWAMPRRIDRPAGLAEPFRRTVEEHHVDLAILRHQLANLLFVVLHQRGDFLWRHARLPARDGLAVLMKKVKIVRRMIETDGDSLITVGPDKLSRQILAVG